jgi:chromosome segregation ATPase
MAGNNDNDPMGFLNDYFERSNQAKQSWDATKKQISVLLSSNQELEQVHEETRKENQSMQREFQVMKLENRDMKKQINDMERAKHASEALAETLQSQVTELSAENQEMRSQIYANKQVIQKAQSELDPDPGYLCGASTTMF